MEQTIAARHSKHFNEVDETFSRTILGFWMYLMTDCLLFAALFSTYAVLHNSTFGGPSSKELFSLPLSLAETLILLTSSLTCGLGLLEACKNKKKAFFYWFIATFALGCSFVALELREFTHLVNEGNSWERSAFLSGFFTLVGTHGLHVSFGLLWMLVMMVQVSIQGLTVDTFRRLVCLNMFWHFLDIIWIFIFSFVYLIGAS